jgi:methylenetetrahydrofolate--tRNA-(uracil-5-)-methyltransferase
VPKTVAVIGGGLAGCEAALQLARRGMRVELWEQRPVRMTAAHTGAGLAELVCSNSLKSTDSKRAQGLLKDELARLDCQLLRIAGAHALPGGAALVVDRERFSAAVTEAIEAEPRITLRREPCLDCLALLDAAACVVVAAGPLAGAELWEQLGVLAGSGGSYFFDATSPVVAASSLDLGVVFAQSRYDKGGGDDYLNCPLDREEYARFRDALLAAEQHPLSTGDDYRLYEGCLPVEELARRGENTLRFGPLKPKGLTDPRTGRWPYAAVQLRWEDSLKQAVSLVGFQTRLRFGEQERVFRLIPGLEQAGFLRFGRMHRNSYFDAPRVLEPTLQLRAEPRLLIAGQLTGLEGYMAAISTGLWAGVNAARLAAGQAPAVAPPQSCLGAMLAYMVNPAHTDYAPTAFQFGMHTWLADGLRKNARAKLIHEETESAWVELERIVQVQSSENIG